MTSPSFERLVLVDDVSSTSADEQPRARYWWRGALMAVSLLGMAGVVKVGGDLAAARVSTAEPMQVSPNPAEVGLALSTVDPCSKCKGAACCCFTRCGQVGNYYLDLDKHGAKHGILDDNGYGKSVAYSENAAKACDAELSHHFTDITRVQTGKPCCLYAGSTGFDWAVTKGVCNALEGMHSVMALLTPQAPTADGHKAPDKVSLCPNTPFPTMFWETISKQWATYLDKNPRCNKEIFVLLPDVHTLPLVDLAKKISLRVELDAIEGGNKIYLVTNDSCPNMHAKFCGEEAIKHSLTGKQVYCIENLHVDHFKYIHTMTTHAPKFAC